MIPLATWTDGFFTLGMMAIVYGLAGLVCGGIDLAIRWCQRPPAAPAVFVGWQEGLPATADHPGVPAMELYNLTAAVGPHPVQSTVTRRTLEAHGYHVPPAPQTLTGSPPFFGTEANAEAKGLANAGADSRSS